MASEASFSFIGSLGAALPRLDRKSFDAVATSGVTVPVSRAILFDERTPVSILASLRRDGDPCFFLEASSAGPSHPRFSFLGLRPRRKIVDSAGEVVLTSEQGSRSYPTVFQALREDCRNAK